MTVDRPAGETAPDREAPLDPEDVDQGSSSPPPELSTKTFKGSTAPGRMPKEIGPYHIKRVIASGGMGTVYEAVQEHPRRTVAVKVMRHGIASRSAMRRFEYESQILARLRHPGIAQVYEAGTHDDGSGSVPFFAMEYIPNAKAITQYAQEKKLGTRERLDLFGKVCDAVHHGHQKGIIHRDLKPSNILVDSTGQPRIIDFGVARATDSDLAVTTLQTDVGQLIGTVQYMSPEQCEADPHDLDTRSDVYALGVVLYELLCRKLPYDVSKVAVYEATRMVREHQPTKLSTLNKTLRGDVETIVLKALEKDRERRYRSAADLADDINHYLTGEAITARPASVIYHFRVLVRRNKGLFVAIAAVLVVLIGGLVGTSYGLAQAVRARQAEAEQRGIAEHNERDAIMASRGHVQAARAADAAKEQAQIERDEARRQAYFANVYAARAALSMNEIASVRRRLDAAPEEFRNWEWGHLYAEADQSLAVLRGHEGGVTSVAFSPDGTRLASGSADETVRIWDPSTGDTLVTLRGHESGVNCVAFSPDGARVASGSGSALRVAMEPEPVEDDNAVHLWDASTGEELLVLWGHESWITSVTFSPDGARLASGSCDRTVRVWDVSVGAELGVLARYEDEVSSVAFSPDGAHLASALGWSPGVVLLWALSPSPSVWSPGVVRLWDLSSTDELPILRGHEGGVLSVAFSPEGNRVASASSDTTARLWDASTGELLAILRGHERAVRSVAFSPDGSRVASASYDKTVRMWDASTGEELGVLRGHESPVLSVAFSPDGDRLASASSDQTVRLWDASAGGTFPVLRGHKDGVNCVAFSPDGAWIASGSNDDTVRIWDASTGQGLAVLRGHRNFVVSVAFAPDGSRLASGSWDGTVRLWDAATGEELAVLRDYMGGAETHRSLTFSRDGTRLADSTGAIWDASTGEELLVLRDEVAHFSVALSPDGTVLASVSHDGTVRIWDAFTGEALTTLYKHRRQPNETVVFQSSSIAFSPDGARVACAPEKSSIRLWETSTGQELLVLRGHENPVLSVAFNPDGTRLASASVDHTVRLWDTSTGEALIILRGHESRVSPVAFSPDGTRLASGWVNNTVRLWDTVPYRIRYQERQAILAAQPEAKRIVDDLWQKHSDWKTVARRLREDTSLTDPMRRAALNEVLRRATDHP